MSIKPFLLVIAGLFACSNNIHRPITPTEAEACDKAETRMIELNCRRKDGSPQWLSRGGNHFKDVCKIAWEDGRDWNAKCIATVVFCGEIDHFYFNGCK